MKAIVKTRPQPGIEWIDVQGPKVRDTDILLKVHAGSLCGSDVHVYEWTSSYQWMPLPIILGHEFSGEVVQVGSRVETLAVGDRINAMPFVPCGRCSLCRAGRGDSCAKKLIFGLTCNGAFAEYVLLPAGVNIFKLPEELTYEGAACCEPLSVALQAVDLSDIKPGHTAAVLGPGPIGLFTLQLLKTAGASLVMMTGLTIDKRRLTIAERLEADVIVDVQKEDPVRRAMDLASGHSGLDFVFETTGDPKAIPQALSMVRPQGKVILIGIHSGPAEFNATDLVRGRKSLIGAWGYEPQTWKRSLTLLSSGKVRVKEMITHRLPLSEAQEGFGLAIRREAAKVIFIP